MTESDLGDLETLDRALLRLRRFLQAPRSVRDGDRPVELSTLLVLDALDTGTGRPTIGDVARRLGVAHSTASRLVQRAVDAGMVTRETGGDDPRTASLAATPAGAALAARARTYRQGQLRRRLHGWTPDDVAAFARALERFAGAEDGG